MKIMTIDGDMNDQASVKAEIAVRLLLVVVLVAIVVLLVLVLVLVLLVLPQLPLDPLLVLLLLVLLPLDPLLLLMLRVAAGAAAGEAPAHREHGGPLRVAQVRVDRDGGDS